MAVANMNMQYAVSLGQSHGADMSIFDEYATDDTKGMEAPLHEDFLSYIGDDRAIDHTASMYIPLRHSTAASTNLGMENNNEVSIMNNYLDLSAMIPTPALEDVHYDAMLSPVFSDDSDSSSGSLWFEGADDHAVPDLLREESYPVPNMPSFASITSSYAEFSLAKQSSTSSASTPRSFKTPNAYIHNGLSCKQLVKASVHKRINAKKSIASKKNSRSSKQCTASASKRKLATGTLKQRATNKAFSASITPPKTNSYPPKVPQMDYTKKVVKMMADAAMMGPPKFPVHFQNCNNSSMKKFTTKVLPKGTSSSVFSGAMEDNPTDRLKKMEGNRRAAKKFRLKQKAKERELHVTLQRLEQINAAMQLELNKILHIKANRP